jgi:hypothetical protein
VPPGLQDAVAVAHQAFPIVIFQMLEEVRGVDQLAALVVERQRAGAQIIEDEPGLRQGLGQKF